MLTQNPLRIIAQAIAQKTQSFPKGERRPLVVDGNVTDMILTYLGAAEGHDPKNDIYKGTLRIEKNGHKVDDREVGYEQKLRLFPYTDSDMQTYMPSWISDDELILMKYNTLTDKLFHHWQPQKS